MSHTIRDLELAWADHVGGRRGRRLRAAIQQPSLLDEIFDRPVPDEVYARELAKIKRTPRAHAKLYGFIGDTWGGRN